MSKSHPENIFPDEPTPFDSESIMNEVRGSIYATSLSAAYLGICAITVSKEFAPATLNAIETANYHDAVGNGLVTATMIGLSGLCVANIKSYGKRWKQARYNNQLLKMSEDNDFE